jgi:murein L,D-transpeptidase YafK
MKTLSLILGFLLTLSLGCRAEFGELSIDQKLTAHHLNKKDIVIYIDKTERTLTLMAGDVLLKEYRCVLGLNPVADKKCEGDRCTPEGEFHILLKRPHEEWDKFMLIDYPNEQSREKFKANKEQGKIPASATIGGGVGIHGIPYNKPYLVEKGINWTFGCISLTNEDVDEVYSLVSVGTKVIITK